MTIKHSIKLWHRMLATGNLKLLDEILADDVVFYSPVLHTPQKGKKLTAMYLAAAYQIFSANDFTYHKQIIKDTQAALEFETQIDGIVINGIDILECNKTGKISSFKVMIRPLQGLQMVQAKMFEMLEKFKQSRAGV